jgi:predicted DNA-binding transcriptional regulator AlpA
MTKTNISELDRGGVEDERLLSRRLLRKLVPVSDMTIWRWERDGRFPQHLSVNGRNYWLYSEIKIWLANQSRGQVPLKNGTAD